MSEVRVERLLGRWVVDSEGRKVGRVEELLAADQDGECRVLEYHLGSYGKLEGIGAMGRLGGALARLISNRSHEGYAVRWDRMDLSDPAHPRLTCRRAELPRL
jgi:hypothetical protein